MHRVFKSQIRGIDFPAAVQAHCEELNAWQKHMAKVGVDPEYVPHPAPQAGADVAASLTEKDGAWVPDFEIIDDDPTPEEVLREKKNVLLARTVVMEREAEAAVVPLGKRRMFAIREGDIRSRDARLRNSIIEAHTASTFESIRDLTLKHADEVAKSTARTLPALQNKHADEMKLLVGAGLTEDDVSGHVEQDRDPADTKFLYEQGERNRRLDAIHRHAALLQHDIEDLTAETVDTWKPEPFPT